MLMAEEEEMIKATGTLESLVAARHTPRAGGTMESRTHCAYNLTRECFLGLEVTAADLPYVGISELLATLTLKSGEGLWLAPFRGLPTERIATPMDLIYLDVDCRVIEMVESYPTFRRSPYSRAAASVLALPVHSIYSSQTQPGDQLLLCVAEEMEQRLAWLAGAGSDRPAPLSDGTSSRKGGTVVESAALLREVPLWGGGPGMVELGARSRKEPAKSAQMHQMELAEPGTRQVRPPRNWLERWWSPDPRQAPREVAPGLAAYYWNGGTPQAHHIRDISASGLYVITEERWYPGTLVLMTLQHTDSGDQAVERTIAVQSRAVRWGSDGVGLQFVLPTAEDLRRGSHNPLTDGVDRKALELFLRKLKKAK